MKLLEIIDISHHYGSFTILEKINAKIVSGDKIALIGANGSGKTTLLEILAQIKPPSEGKIVSSAHAKIALVHQHIDIQEGETVETFLLKPYQDIIEGLRSAEQDLSRATEENMEKMLSRYEAAREAYDEIEGDFLLKRAESHLNALGLDLSFEREVSSLSGGEQNLVALAAKLMGKPDLLILDEPGNHLDMQGLNWLEAFLSNWDGALLLVSHNRFLIDRVCDTVWELENKSVNTYSGNYSSYRLEKLNTAVNQQADYKASQVKIARLEALVKKFQNLATQTADPAWGQRYRAKRSQLEREKEHSVDKPTLNRDKISVKFHDESSKSNIALEIRQYSKAFGDNVLFESASAAISSGERVVLVGENGSGKTTLLEEIVSTANWEHPYLRLGPSQHIAYLQQKPENLNDDVTIEDFILRLGPLSKADAFQLIAPLLFTYEDMQKSVQNLSGGEKNRLQLAVLRYSQANFLILDEPTNHMDIQSREAIEDALADFHGTLLIVSHDRYFLEKFADKIFYIRDKVIHTSHSGFGEFLLESGWLGKSQGTIKGRGKERQKKFVQSASLLEIEKKIENYEKEKIRLEKEIETAFKKSDHKSGRDLTKDLRKVNKLLDDLYIQWESKS